MEAKFKLISSLEKVFFDYPEELSEQTCGSMLKNEIYSFQLACWMHDDRNFRPIWKLELSSDLVPYIKMYSVGYVPVLLTTRLYQSDDDYISKKPGLFPDPLHRLKDGTIELASDQARAFWFAVEAKGAKPGKYPIEIRILNESGEVMGQKCFTLTILDAELPALDIFNSGWFHGDCLATLHNVPVMSEEYFALVEKYLEVYVKFGHTAILTPVFTPPLDTAIGGERPTNQLVDVFLQNGKYNFGFKNLKRWLDMCRRFGIEIFEISHLFTQWGAKFTPKIMATVDGEYKRIFGWDTSGLSPAYKAFLDAFLPELVAFLKQEQVFDRCLFHISDEPTELDAEQYAAAQKLLLPYIPEDQLIDALTSYELYERGIIKHPIVSCDNMHTFMENGAKNLFTYYCVGQRERVANRFMAMPSYRNRVLGCQLYKTQTRGFLQWGFNFWFTSGSTRAVNPYQDPCGGGRLPAGDPFIVYPLDQDGDVVISHRLYVFYDGLQDYRALKLLESLTDRQTVESLLSDISGFEVYPRNSKYLLALREEVNRLIAVALEKAGNCQS